jgi:hypothetical protein
MGLDLDRDGQADNGLGLHVLGQVAAELVADV